MLTFVHIKPYHLQKHPNLTTRKKKKERKGNIHEVFFKKKIKGKENLPRQVKNGVEDPRKTEADTRISPECVQGCLSEHIFDCLDE